MHKAVTILMLKLECKVIDRNPDFQDGRAAITSAASTGRRSTVADRRARSIPCGTLRSPRWTPTDPAALNDDEQAGAAQTGGVVSPEREACSEHVEFLYAKGSVYHIENGNLLYHGAVPMTQKGTFAVERFEGHTYSGRALMDYCDERARRGLLLPRRAAPPAADRTGLFVVSVVRQAFAAVWPQCHDDHLRAAVCGGQKPPTPRPEDPYYRYGTTTTPSWTARILAEFGLDRTRSHIVNGHVPVRAEER